jgi:hypothetical protein
MVAGEWIGAGIAFSAAVFTAGNVLRDQIKAKAAAKIVPPEAVVFKDFCTATHNGLRNELSSIKDDLQIIKRAVTKV